MKDCTNCKKKDHYLEVGINHDDCSRCSRLFRSDRWELKEKELSPIDCPYYKGVSCKLQKICCSKDPSSSMVSYYYRICQRPAKPTQCAVIRSAQDIATTLLIKS